MACDSEFTLPEFIELTELDTISIMSDSSEPFKINTPPLDEEATIDSALRFPVMNPICDQSAINCNQSVIFPQPLGPPDRSPMYNKHSFTVEISSTDTNKKKYLYSCQLNKVYVDMNCDFAVQFSWRSCNGLRFVRATVVFSDEDQAEKRVERCVQHRHENSTDVPENIRMNVLRSSREIGTQGVVYQGDPSRPDSWYSVLVDFANNTQPCLHAFKFVCKNSCSSGINRRSIAIIFTLEDVHGIVYGRQMVGVRVCACPRRDLLKDEEAEGRSVKRPAPPPAPARAKKVKLELLPPAPHRTALCRLPNLEVVGMNVVVTGLEVMIRMMEQGVSSRPDDVQYVTQCNVSISLLKAAIDQYRRDSGTQ